LLKHVQAHIAPTDVDPGAGLQWLPRILAGTAKLKRTGTLLERIFMPCTMYFQYTRHKGGTTNFEVLHSSSSSASSAAAIPILLIPQKSRPTH
jgi:hypothetical protein